MAEDKKTPPPARAALGIELIAKHSVIVGAGKDQRTVNPGETFTVPAADAKWLIDNGAASLPAKVVPAASE